MGTLDTARRGPTTLLDVGKKFFFDSLLMYTEAGGYPDWLHYTFWSVHICLACHMQSFLASSPLLLLNQAAWSKPDYLQC